MSIFKAPKTPAVTAPDPLPPAPTRTDAENTALAEEQRNKFGRTGRASTMLTTGQGAAAVTSASRYLGTSART